MLDTSTLQLLSDAKWQIYNRRNDKSLWSADSIMAIKVPISRWPTFQHQAPFHTYVWILKDDFKAKYNKNFDINNVSLHWTVRSGFITFELLKMRYFFSVLLLMWCVAPFELKLKTISKQTQPRRCGRNNKAKKLSSVACVVIFLILEFRFDNSFETLLDKKDLLLFFFFSFT